MTDEPDSVADSIQRLLDGERTTGQEWLGSLMEGFGHVHFNAFWVVFSIGQGGMALDLGNVPLAREMIGRLHGDISDLEAACEAFIRIARDMQANAQRNVDAREDA